jgi:hypothetical protein
MAMINRMVMFQVLDFLKKIDGFKKQGETNKSREN